MLPNSSRVLIQWGLGPRLEKLATIPEQVTMIGWKGDEITSYDFQDAAKEYQAPFWDFHRADLHGAMLDRARELGVSFETNARVVNVECESSEVATVVLGDGCMMQADLIVGADGIFSRCRELLLGAASPPIATGDLAYRVLLSTEGMLDDPDLAVFLKTHHVRCWMGPKKHAVTYVLRDGALLNMVLLVPDDMPPGASTVDASVEEMRALFHDWDPRIPKLLQYCKSVQKWRLSFRPGLECPWYNSFGTFTLLGDAVHATLPYLASGAGMSLEDGAALGYCFSKVHDKSIQAKRQALSVYEKCRRSRTESIVERGNLQQWLYHLDDGDEQRARDARFRAFGEIEKRVNAEGTHEYATAQSEGLVEGTDPLAWRRYGVGKWLISYDCMADVDLNWPKESGLPQTQSFRASL